MLFSQSDHRVINISGKPAEERLAILFIYLFLIFICCYSASCRLHAHGLRIQYMDVLNSVKFIHHMTLSADIRPQILIEII